MITLLDRLAAWWMDLRMSQVINADPELQTFNLKKAEMTEDGFVATFVSPAIVMLADEAAGMLEKGNAKNYIQIDMMPRLIHGKRPIRVTVQWASGESPAHKATRLQKLWESIPRTSIAYVAAMGEALQKATVIADLTDDPRFQNIPEEARVLAGVNDIGDEHLDILETWLNDIGNKHLGTVETWLEETKETQL